MLKEYETGISGAPKIYFLDTDVLVSMTQIYYRGKCKVKEDTDDVKKFIIKARKDYIYNGFAITEISYDYNTNSLNTEEQNKNMYAYDYLIEKMSEDALWKHNGTMDPGTRRNEKRLVHYQSIFDCKLPEFLCADCKEGIERVLL